MGSVRDLAEKLWNGEITTYEHHPWTAVGDIEEIANKTIFYRSFANVTAFDTDARLVLIDTGAYFNVAQTHQALRSWSKARLNTAVYTHGHVDHVFGVPPFAVEAKTNGWAAPRVIGHEAVAARFDRYILTGGYNSIINQRQFVGSRIGGRGREGAQARPVVTWPTEYQYPDTTYDEALTTTVGGTRFELYHARGETDDHTWVWVPGRKVLCPGDLIIWAVPNAGNPQKVQRYANEWAQALRKMAALNAEVLSPGHGIIVVGQERVRQILLDTAEFLQSLHDQTIHLMNQGATLDEIIHTVKPPAHLEGRPYLQPVYDEPQYIVRNVYRLYGGWYDGNPANLKPSPEAEQAAEIVRLASGLDRLLKRTRELVDSGNLTLACHVIEWAAKAAPEDPAVHELRAQVYERRLEKETATMTRGVFRWAMTESKEVIGE